MAEKEERIYISGYSETNPCDVCDDLSGEECDYCEKNREWNASISRQEAIERMVLAMHNEDIKRSIKEIPCDYNHLAEAALNALLER